MSKKVGQWTRAQTNIALIKYWGKEQEDLIIPKNNSLSLTLDAFYTETQVTFDENLKEDELWIDGEKQSGVPLKKALVVLDLVRERAYCSWFAKVDSINHVPTAAGLASSASGLAALAGAASNALDLDLSEEELSRLARRGSGSASRSVAGGFVEWEKGHDDQTSVAKQFDEANWDIGMLFIIVDNQKKDVSSSQGMKLTVNTSVFYQAWLDTLDQDLQDMKHAIKAQDIEAVGQIAERNALKMHATNLGANPPFTYWTAESIIAMEKVRDFREQGYTVYFTMDAGPNVKMIGKKAELKDIYKQLLDDGYTQDQLILANPGQGIQYLDKE